jgi:hypothetical protein
MQLLDGIKNKLETIGQDKKACKTKKKRAKKNDVKV